MMFEWYKGLYQHKYEIVKRYNSGLIIYDVYERLVWHRPWCKMDSCISKDAAKKSIETIKEMRASDD